MEPIGFGLGLIGEVRHQIRSIKTRITMFQEGQQRFQTLTGKLDRLLRHIGDVERYLGTFQNSVPSDLATLFDGTMADVRDSVRDENATLPLSLAKAFDGGGSSAMGKLKPKARQLTRANALSEEMSSLETKIEYASNKLLHQASVLTDTLNSKETQTILGSKIGSHRDETQACYNTLLSKLDELQVAESVQEVYRASFNGPAPSHSIILNFDSRDDEGNPNTPEGLLKQSVLHGESSETVTAATGAIKPAYGVLGMAGVGKTVALQGLCHDEEVRVRFHDGIHYLRFGAGFMGKNGQGLESVSVSNLWSSGILEKVKRCY